MKTWAVKLVNSNPDLAKIEMTTLFDIEDDHDNSSNDNHNYDDNNSITWLDDGIFLVTCGEQRLNGIIQRSSTIKLVLAGPLIIDFEILKDTNKLKQIKAPRHFLADQAEGRQTFAARFYHINTEHQNQDTLTIEKNLGSWIYHSDFDMKVDLENPDTTFIAVSWGPQAAVGWLYKENKFQDINWRAPKFTPYFRGGGMKPRLCRTMVNLHGKLNAMMMDPFSGHGGILREIADFNRFAIGIELSKKVCFEQLDNNITTGYDDLIAPILGDATKPAMRKIHHNQIVTDPPYALQTTTNGKKSVVLVAEWLNIQEVGTEIIFAVPKTMNLSITQDWHLFCDVSDYVHGSLSRRIRRIKRIGGSQ